jgi:hypothetical protein
MFTKIIPFYIYSPTFSLIKVFHELQIKELKYGFINGNNTNIELQNIKEYINLGGKIILCIDTSSDIIVDFFNYYKEIMEKTHCYHIDLIIEDSNYNIPIDILSDLLVIFPELIIDVSINFNLKKYINDKNITTINLIFNDYILDINTIKKALVYYNIKKTGIVIRYNSINNLKLNKKIDCISYFHLALDKDLSLYNSLLQVKKMQINNFCNELIGINYLCNYFYQYNKDWLAIDNVVFSDEYKFAGRIIDTNDINNILNSFKMSNTCTIINFDNDKKCYQKNGIGMAMIKQGFTCFILKSSLPQYSILNEILDFDKLIIS